MDKFEFYKDCYFKELNKKDEINNSLSLPIGLITALIAGIFYLITNFDYRYSIFCTTPFLLPVAAGLFAVILSIYYLIKAYNGFPKRYDYVLIPDANDIENYYQQLKAFYRANATLADTADQEIENYILSEMIKNTDDNQKSNKRKLKHSYNCEKQLIIAFICICISLPSFVINYCVKPEKRQLTDVQLVNPAEIPVFLNSKENRNFILEILKDSAFMRQENTHNIIQKPVAPPSQIITEGQDPRPKPNLK